ncbi:MAG: sigma-70 domain-containing protein [Polyangiaceae bacterium]
MRAPKLPPKLEPVLARLLAQSDRVRRVTLDAVGEAIGVVAVSTDDVDVLLGALEAAGCEVVGPEGARGVANLRRVLPAARALAATLGRPPTLAELSKQTGLSEEDVRHALALGRVMGR